MRVAPAVVLLALSAAPPARAECRSSAAGAYSVDVRLSLAAGYLCLMDVEVFAGADCRPEQSRWRSTRGCNETERLAVTDAGNLVSILAPATTHHAWAIVEILSWRDGRVLVTTLSLDDLPGTADLPGAVRPVFDGAAVRCSADVVVPFATLESLAAR